MSAIAIFEVRLIMVEIAPLLWSIFDRAVSRHLRYRIKDMTSRIIGKINLDSYDFSTDVAFLNSVEKSPEEYDEFAFGYWKNLSLYNGSGRTDDTQYRNCDVAKPTEYMSGCPSIAKMLSDNFDLSLVKMVRARNLISGLVIPHRDFVELDPNVSYFRVFIPIELNLDAYHSDESGVFQMKPGEVWFLDAAVSHAAVNFSSESRMFICLDFAFDGAFAEDEIFAASAQVSSSSRDIHVLRPSLPPNTLSEMIDTFTHGIDAGTIKQQIIEAAKVHFRFNVPTESCYDWLIKAALASPVASADVAERLRGMKRYLLEARGMNERFSLDSQ
ncbi:MULTISPECIES: aspartyl/asparaginyl beta-hydroxylase domain-containing protein [Stenotrophomonas]|uniref:aspartyl/asparaginyl beta-hydroxylase domain-containing protein n=1 Tax=Stenotrophomonas TaxID=40323 RepID=UPI00159F63EB|nr:MULTISPECIES: aspartyl/asparaginyl beta-hydroxylase domain-containing protein [Stenotrophomonas]